MNDFDDYQGLSQQGRRRREEILWSAIRAARTRRRRRRSMQVAAGAAVTVIAIFLSISFHQVQRAPTRIVRNAPMPIVPNAPRNPPGDVQVVVTEIHTDPTLLQRLAVPPQKPDWKILSDDELLRVLADAGKPAGLDYEPSGQVAVLYRNP
jgi:hypothetical protein